MFFVLGGLAGLVYPVNVIRAKRSLNFVTLVGLDWISCCGWLPALAERGFSSGGAGLMFPENVPPLFLSRLAGI